MLTAVLFEGPSEPFDLKRTDSYRLAVRTLDWSWRTSR